MKELKKIIHGIEITYKIKQRKYDTQHLIIVFSGFGSSGALFTYDFENALQDCPATILWVKDDFFGNCAYYICRDNDLNISEAVFTFITNILRDLFLTKDQCTLIGFSKGGSAALYFGLKYGFKNIFSSVPQLRIGSYVKKHWGQVAKHMIGSVNDKKIDFLDSLIPKLLHEDLILDKNIYLLTSTSDSQYENEIKPYLYEFIKYKNFNIFYAKSMLVTEHSQVTAYHVPLILAICYSISQGAIPVYGCCNLEGDNKSGIINGGGNAITILKKIKISGHTIFPEGISVIKGLPCGEYKDIKLEVIFKSTTSNYKMSYSMAKEHRSILSRHLYDGGYVNYSKGWFCTLRHEGLNISDLNAGSYQVFLKIICQGVMRVSRLKVDSPLINNLTSNEVLKLECDDGYLNIIKK